MDSLLCSQPKEVSGLGNEKAGLLSCFMKHFTLFIFCVSVTVKLGAQSIWAESYRIFETGVETSIRAIEVLNDSVVWFSGSGSVIGYTNNGGKHWKIDTLETDSTALDLRLLSILNEHTAIVGNAGSPAYLFKTNDAGETWKRLYENDNPEIFLDCIRFSDANHGLVIGDPILGCFQVLSTSDGGET